MLSQLLILVRHEEGETLFIYLYASIEALRFVLIQENETSQNPVYLISKVLKRLKVRYKYMEKIVLILLKMTHKLVRTDYLIRKVFYKPT